jgi:hypothetical protein
MQNVQVMAPGSSATEALGKVLSGVGSGLMLLPHPGAKIAGLTAMEVGSIIALVAPSIDTLMSKFRVAEDAVFPNVNDLGIGGLRIDMNHAGPLHGWQVGGVADNAVTSVANTANTLLTLQQAANLGGVGGLSGLGSLGAYAPALIPIAVAGLGVTKFLGRSKANLPLLYRKKAGRMLSALEAISAVKAIKQGLTRLPAAPAPVAGVRKLDLRKPGMRQRFMYERSLNAIKWAMEALWPGYLRSQGEDAPSQDFTLGFIQKNKDRIAISKKFLERYPQLNPPSQPSYGIEPWQVQEPLGVTVIGAPGAGITAIPTNGSQGPAGLGSGLLGPVPSMPEGVDPIEWLLGEIEPDAAEGLERVGQHIESNGGVARHLARVLDATDRKPACCDYAAKSLVLGEFDGSLKAGEFFRSGTVVASVAPTKKGYFGVVQLGSLPFRIEISNGIGKGRGAIALAHEFAHVADRVLKLNMKHEQVHHLGHFIATEVVPGMNAFNARA